MARDVILRFLSDTTGLKKGFSEASKGAQESETVFGRLEGKISGVSSQAALAAAGMAGVATSVVAFATEAVNRLGEEEKAAAQTAAAIRSTGGAAQVTAGHVGTMADQLARMSGVDNEVVQTGENLLLTFTNIQNRVGAGNDIFDQATKAALNMSVALGEDMSAAAMQLGKALQDPVAGVTALRRVGVELNDEQKASIGAFVKMGDVASAQKIILTELNKEFGGSAEAYGKTLPGAIGRAKTAVEDWSADVARKALPAVQSFAQTVVGLAKTVGPPFVDAFKKAGDAIVGVGRFLVEHKGYVAAVAAVYTASLIPAVVKSAAAFAKMEWAKIADAITLFVYRLQYATEGMTAFSIALSGLTVGAITVGLGYVIERLTTSGQKAKEFASSLTKGYDLQSLEGVRGALADTYQQLSSLQDRLAHKGNPIIDFITFKGLNILDLANKRDAAKKTAEALEDEANMITSVAKRYGVSAGEVVKFANAQGIDLTGPVSTTTQLLEDQYGATVEATKGWTGYALSAADAAQIQDDLKKAFEDAADPVKVYAAALQTLQQSQSDANKSQADQIRSNAQAARDAVDTRHQAEKAALDSEFITGKASQAAHDRRVKLLEDQQAAENKAAEATYKSENQRADAIEHTKTATTLSMEEYRKAVEKNTADTTKWMTNLALIAARGGGDFVDQLAQLGPGAAGLVAEVARSSKPEFDKFAGTMRAASKTAVDETATELNKLPDEVQTIAQTSGQKFADTLVHQVAVGLKQLPDIVVEATKDALDAAVAAATDQAIADAANLHDKVMAREEGLYGAPSAPPSGAPTAASGPGAPFSFSNPSGYPVVIGGHAEGHIAQIAPAGSWRVWAEPETGGEAYIPLASSKRSRSTQLVAAVANQFGYGLVPMAAGGMWGRSVMAEGRGRARGAAQIGPIVFNEKVDPLHVARRIAWQVG
jgi:hypothetical protein